MVSDVNELAARYADVHRALQKQPSFERSCLYTIATTVPITDIQFILLIYLDLISICGT